MYTAHAQLKCDRYNYMHTYVNHSKEAYMPNILPKTEIRGGLQQTSDE